MTPHISDLKTGSEIIAQVPLTNPPAASQEFERILDGLSANPPDRETYFRLLELIRVPVEFVAEELAKRYVGKAVPLADLEDGFFNLVVRLWQKMAKAYARCAESSPLESDPAQMRRFATLLHRCIYFTGMTIVEHYRARRELPWGLWLDLHGHYGTAEDLRLGTLHVSNLTRDLADTRCVTAYLAFILYDMAGGHNLAPRDQILLRRWVIDDAAQVDLHTAAVGEKLPPFVIDLMQDVALRPSAECLRTDQIRRLDVSRLAARINHLRQKLRKGSTPAQLGLGDDCTQTQCSRLLAHLSLQWSHARAARKFRRHAASGTTQICTGFEEMHYFISGKVFLQPDGGMIDDPAQTTHIRSHREYEYLFAFGFNEDSAQALQHRQKTIAASYHLDSWEVVNQSANGFRLMRNLGGRKMAHGQLAAVRPHDSDRFLLAQVTWLMQESKGGLTAGVRALPGLPSAIGARPADPGNPSAPYQRAFLLSALAAGARQSLVLPTGWFRPDRIVEVFTDRVWQARLTSVLDSGPDFECVEFERC